MAKGSGKVRAQKKKSKAANAEVKVIEASMAAAIGAKLCRPEVIPMYPITPQTHVVEDLAEFINNGELHSEMIHTESEHSAISAAIGSSAAGVRTFTASSSQGLALMHEILFVVSGLRLPVVMAVANRALSAPINIWNDHQDTISERDAGWIQLYVESAQELIDTIIQGFKISEDKRVLLPIMVCFDGFTLSHVFEPVSIPSQKKVDSFLEKYRPTHMFLDPRRPMTIGPIAFPSHYMDIKLDQQEATLNSLKVIKEVNSKFSSSFKRSYGDGLLELYRMKDAQYALLAIGTICGTARVVVDELRKKGAKVGMIKLRCLRPFPTLQIVDAVKKLKGLGVLDRNISLGNDGAVYSEVRSAVFGMKKTPVINNFIVGLGGRDVTPDHIKTAFSKLKKQSKAEWLL